MAAEKATTTSMNFNEKITGNSVVIFVLRRMFLNFFLMKIRSRANYVDVENNMVFMG